MEQSPYPDPNPEVQWNAATRAIAKTAHDAELLSESGFHREATVVRLGGLAEYADRLNTLERTLAVAAISDGLLSRVEVAKRLGVHQGTVANWVNDAKNKPEPEPPRTEEPR